MLGDDVGSIGVPRSSLPGLWLLSLFDEKDVPLARDGGVSGEFSDDSRDSWGLKGDCCATSLKMWTVSVALETERRDDVALNDMQYICAGRDPRRKWKSRSPEGMLQTRITVPFSDAVARNIPVLFIARDPSVVW